MPLLDKIQKHKNASVVLVYNGANSLGVELSKLLLEQGAFIIVVDKYTEDKKKKVSGLLKNDLFSFVDITGIKSLVTSLSRLDYVFYFNNNADGANQELSTSEFLERSNSLDRLLQLCVDKKSKFLLTSSIEVHRSLQAKQGVMSELELDEDNLKYTALEVQRYAENLTWEYYKQGGVNGRIIRVGNLLGEGVDLNENGLVYKYIKAAVDGDKLHIEGDGLENMYFVHVLDAAYGLVKAQFTKKTTGNVYSLVIPRDTTILNLAYKILDLEPKAEGIEFDEDKDSRNLSIYKPAKNLEDVGWKPKISFERALAQSIDYYYTKFGIKRDPRQVENAEQTDGEKDEIIEKLKSKGDSRKQKKSIKERLVGFFFHEKREPKKRNALESKRKKDSNKKKTLKDKIIDFFFEVEEVEDKKSILDNVQFQPKKGVLDSRDKVKQKSRVHLGDNQKSYFEKKKSNSKSERNIIKKLKDVIEMPFKWISSLSLARFLGYLIFSFVLFFIYILFLVPGIRFFYNSSMMGYYIQKAANAYEDDQYEEVVSYLTKADNFSKSSQENISSLSLLSFMKVYEKLESFQGDLLKISKAIDSSINVYSGLAKSSKYFDTYKSSIRENEKGELVIVESENYNIGDLSESLEQLSLSVPTLRQDLGELEIGNVPWWSENMIKTQEDMLALKEEALNYAYNLAILPSLIGSGGNHTYAMLILDNKELNSLGGEIRGGIVFEFANGDFTKLKAFQSEEVDFELSSVQKGLVEQNIGGFFSVEDMRFQDITAINNKELFYEICTLVLLNNYEEFENIDTVVTLNPNVIKELNSLVGELDVSNVGASNSDRSLENIISSGDFQYLELLEEFLLSLSEMESENIEGTAIVGSKLINTKDVSVFTRNNELYEHMRSIGLLHDKKRFSLVEPEVFYITDSSVKPDLEITSQITISSEGEKMKYIFDFEQNQTDFQADLIINFDQDAQLVQVKGLGEEEYSTENNNLYYEFKIKSGEKKSFSVELTQREFENYFSGEYNYKVYVRKGAGVSYLYKVDVDIEEGFTVKESIEDSIVEEKTMRYRSDIREEEILNFILEKEEISNE